MFQVNDVLVSDELLEAPFHCNLGACKGGCCVHGDSGAPLEKSELPVLEEYYPIVKKYLRPKAIDVIEKDGLWVKEGRDDYGTSCVDGAECVFVHYDGSIAKCAFQTAFNKNEIDFPKPISCHLFPVRVSHNGVHEVLNYEKIDLCKPAVRMGKKKSMMLPNFLKEPLVRKYGPKWYKQFIKVCTEHLDAVS